VGWGCEYIFFDPIRKKKGGDGGGAMVREKDQNVGVVSTKGW